MVGNLLRTFLRIKSEAFDVTSYNDRNVGHHTNYDGSWDIRNGERGFDAPVGGAGLVGLIEGMPETLA
jgi:hypothetical protein